MDIFTIIFTGYIFLNIDHTEASLFYRRNDTYSELNTFSVSILSEVQRTIIIIIIIEETVHSIFYQVIIKIQGGPGPSSATRRARHCRELPPSFVFAAATARRTEFR